ncbi:regulator of nonsense transcripts 1 [Pancytospora philotis]|nr:regulator of nonsense transcripts 1 [Pancytospora philotis]
MRSDSSAAEIEGACEMCGKAAPRIKCGECGEHLCNDTSNGISHAVYHLVKRQHRSILLDGCAAKCAECGEGNVFRLVHAVDRARGGDAFYCSACRDSPTIISNKIFVILDSAVSAAKLDRGAEAGERGLPKMRLRFDAQSYVDTFIPLVTAESMKEKEIKESMRQENVTLRFADRFCFFYFRRLNNDLKINIGDEIRFSHKSGASFSGFISDDQFSEELRVEIDARSVRGDGGAGIGGLPHTGYVVEYVWRAVCYERMCWALKKLARDKKKSEIFSYILRGRKEKAGEIDILSPPGFYALNESQEVAVKAALTRTLTLIQGPPGTGKTMVSSVIVYNVVRLLKKKVLVVAPSNTAVDQLALKINSAGLKVLRIMSRRRETSTNETDFLSLHTLLKEFDDTDAAKHELIRSAEVVCCTCVTAGQKLFNRYNFPFVLIDEAVQSTEPLSLIPCVYGATNLVLVGDHKQLGPTILNKEVVRAGYKQSLFERLLRIGVSPYMLSVQYRMHPDLCQFPSEYFYGGLLKTGMSPNRCLNFPSNFFYVSNGKEEISQSGTSFINRAEAVLVENIIRYLFKNGVLEQQIGVITPYEGQRSYILSKIFANEPGNLEISNVDGFQGREKDFIIVSLVRSNTYQGIGFVADKRRMNVALTRAKHGLAIVGNPFTLYKNEMWANLLDWYDARGSIFEGPVGALKKMNLKSFDMKSLVDAVQ